jgi:broad specificity phosphatase PhoE
MTMDRHERRPSVPRVPENVHFLLVRHGQTALNAAGQLRGRLDPVLDDVGQSEVELLADALTAYSPQLIVSSPVRRAAQTAAAIARATGAGILIDGDLVDRDYGQWAGHTREEVIERWGSVDQTPGVETRASLTHRAVGMLHKEFRAYPVVLVTHEVVLQAMLEHLDPTLGTVRQDLAAWDVVTRDESGHLLLDGADLRASQASSGAMTRESGD